ncbi:MAG: hypothetical protein RBS91_08655 [Sulfurimonadaceae bacterium]|jgi:hypothetical protein|nr:hypothetical protein [Sulfurimonadaceae bacterium]
MLKLGLSVALSLSLASLSYASSSDGMATARQGLSAFGSKGSLQSNAVSPLQGGGDMKTVDKSTSFTATIDSCAQNNDGIRLTFTPQASGVLNLTINQDLAASGSYDYSVSLNNIQNICSGGVMDVSNKSYQYHFSPSTKKITFFEAPRDALGGCFCVTNACGYGGFSQNTADKVVGDLIGVIGSSGVANYRVGINRYDGANKTYYLYVKNDSTCKDSSLGNDYTNTNPQSYFESQNSVPIGMEDVAAKDGMDSSSLYYNIKGQNKVAINTYGGGAMHDITMENMQDCVITKRPTTDDNGNDKVDINDGCIANYSCSIEREEICDIYGKNCVDRIINGVSTGNNIATQCLDLGGYQACANGSNISTYKDGTAKPIYNSANDSYFYIHRIYNCGSQTVTHDASKTNNTLNSVDKSGSNIDYVDFEGASQNIELGEFGDCYVKNCRVKISTYNTQVYSDNTSNKDTKDGTSTIDYEFRQCTQLADGSDVCPIEGSNETVLDPCSCKIGMGAAALAIGYAAAVEDAVKDFTCSTN